MKIGKKLALGFLCNSISITVALKLGDFEVEMSEVLKEKINSNLSLTQNEQVEKFVVKMFFRFYFIIFENK